MTFLRIPMRREAGFSLVELMVGMLIGLIAIVVMFQIFAVSEGQRRTTAGAGEAQQNGVTSLFLMERDARLAGYGLNYFPLLGCNTNGYYTPAATTFNFLLTPIVITDGAGGIAPDKLTILYAGTDSFALPGTISPPDSTDKTPGYVMLKDARFPFKNGDLFVLAEVPAGAAAMKPCSLFQVTDTPPGDYAAQVKFGAQFYLDDTLTTRPALYNPPTSSGSTQPPPNNVYYNAWARVTSSGGRLVNLGAQPVLREYSIPPGGSQLVAKDLLLPNQPAVPISDGIVQFQVQYGFSGSCPLMPPAPPAVATCSINPATATNVTTINTAGVADQWGDKLPAVLVPGDWRRIIAMRFALVARSTTMEKPNPATGVCDATPFANRPKWSVNGRDLDVQTANPSDWMCYRYRVFEAVVPIRNLLWYPDPAGQATN